MINIVKTSLLVIIHCARNLERVTLLWLIGTCEEAVIHKGLIIAAHSNIIPFFWYGIALDNNNNKNE